MRIIGCHTLFDFINCQVGSMSLFSFPTYFLFWDSHLISYALGSLAHGMILCGSSLTKFVSVLVVTYKSPFKKQNKKPLTNQFRRAKSYLK